jgi:hypothetical protein
MVLKACAGLGDPRRAIFYLKKKMPPPTRHVRQIFGCEDQSVRLLVRPFVCISFLKNP